MARITPLSSTLEDQLMEFHHNYNRAMADGAIDLDEADVLISVMVGMVPAVTEMAITMRTIGTFCNSAHGIFTDAAERVWNEAHRSRNSNVVAFPSLHGGTGNQQSGD